LVAIGLKGWAHDINLVDGLSGDQQLGIDITTVEQVHTGEEMTHGPVILNERAHDTIRVAGVVMTPVMRCGWPSSQVSVRCTL
jgi:hypothetical protein